MWIVREHLKYIVAFFSKETTKILIYGRSNNSINLTYIIEFERRLFNGNDYFVNIVF